MQWNTKLPMEKEQMNFIVGLMIQAEKSDEEIKDMMARMGTITKRDGYFIIEDLLKELREKNERERNIKRENKRIIGRTSKNQNEVIWR